LTFKDLQKLIQKEQAITVTSVAEQENPRLSLLLSKLRNKPFWYWDTAEHKRKYKQTNGDCCFNHVIGLPRKDGIPKPLFDYERLIYDYLITNNQKLLWVKKATGLGISEFMLRLMSWLCLKDDKLSGSQMIIVTGPNIDIAIKLIKRMKALFQNPNKNKENIFLTFNSKETVLELNHVNIEAFPSHHLDAARALESPKFILLDESDFFSVGQQQDARDVSERYIAKSNPYIVMVSTPNAPNGLFEKIESEPEETCLYKRLKFDFTYGLDRIYTYDEIEKAKRSPSFEREYNLKYLGLIGNVFHAKDIEAALERGRNYNPETLNLFSQKSMGIDPGFGSSEFGVVVTERSDGQIKILHADEYHRPDFNEMLSIVWKLLNKYGRTINKVYVDGANSSFIRALKIQMGEETNYEEIIKEAKTKKLNYLLTDMHVIPINFSTEHKMMLGNCKILMEKNGGYVSINPKFTKLITSLRTAVEEDGTLDKEDTSYDDVFDAFRLALRHYYVASSEEEIEKGRSKAFIVQK
jgi:hypothetical protein